MRAGGGFLAGRGAVQLGDDLGKFAIVLAHEPAPSGLDDGLPTPSISGLRYHALH